jgi:hypothetical protein
MIMAHLKPYFTKKNSLLAYTERAVGEKVTWQRFLCDAGSPEVNVLWRGVDGGVVLHRLVGHQAQQVVPVVNGMEAAPVPPPETVQPVDIFSEI